MTHTYGHWQSPWEFDPDDWYGFVYRIINTQTQQQYVGKKQLRSRQRKKVAGRKNRRVVYRDSGWHSYTGSSRLLNEHIAAGSEHQFEYHICSLHETKASLYYAEVLTQIHEDVLRARLSNGEPKYYNGLIAAVKFRPPEPTDRERAHCTQPYL